MTYTPTDLEPRQQREFPSHLEECLRNLRGALTELLASVEADPAAPQVVSRRFRINKNLAWKVSKIVNAPDLVGVASHVPGPAGGKILLQAMAKGGAPTGEVGRARRALEEYEEMVRLHAGDRASLDLLLSSMLPHRVESKNLEASRKLSFQGNSATWGIQARAQVTLHVLSPSSHPDLVDGVSVQGLVDFCRLRPSATWPVARYLSWRQGERPSKDESRKRVRRALDPRSVGENVPPLLQDYCTGALPELREVPVDNGIAIELGPGPVGNTATATCFTGVIKERVATRYGSSEDAVASMRAVLNTPVEAQQFDLLFHRELGFGQPEATILSAMEALGNQTLDGKENSVLPTTESVESLGAGPPVMASPLYPRYRELVSDVVRYAGHDLDEYEGWRFVLRYPPIPTQISLRFKLPLAPDAR